MVTNKIKKIWNISKTWINNELHCKDQNIENGLSVLSYNINDLKLLTTNKGLQNPP